MSKNIANLTILLSTNPLFSLPPIYPDFREGHFIFNVLQIYVEQFSSEDVFGSSELTIEMIVSNLQAIFLQFELNHYQEAKYQFSLLLKKMIHHYPLLTDTLFSSNEKFETGLYLDFTLNPFYDHQSCLVYHYYWNKLSSTMISHNKLVRNYWHWYPIIYLTQIKLSSSKRKKYLYPFKYALEQFLIKLSKKINRSVYLICPNITANPGFNNHNVYDSFMCNYFSVQHPYIKQFVIDDRMCECCQ